MIQRQVLPIALPIAIFVGYAATISAGGVIEDAWDDFFGPFLITYWIGLGFTNMWDVVRQSLHGASPLLLAVVGVGGSLFLLGMLGGPEVLIDEPWIFGAAIAPGLELLVPLLRNRNAPQIATAPESPVDPPKPAA